MTARTTFAMLDHDSEVGTMAVHAATLTAANFTAQMGLADDLRDAIEAVIVGEIQKDTRFAVETKFTVSPPADPWAQRETKWLVRMVEAGTGNSVNFEIPTADLAQLSPGTEKLDITAGNGLALVTAIEAYVTSNDGTNVTVQEIVHVSRSS